MEEKSKPDIRMLNLEEINEFFISHGDKPFKAKQVWDWLWKKSVVNFDGMSNISIATRKFLKDNFVINTTHPSHQIQVSDDKTIKLTFQFNDKNIVEGVLIPTEDRMTACVSSQIGCSMSCKFCATGKLGFTRNLLFYEIYDQVAILSKIASERYNHPLTNIVFMGMGEPLLNYKNLLKAIERITAPDGLNMSPSRITVSTVGISNMIKRLGDNEVKFNLALSLHAANDEKRSKIIPFNDINSLKNLKNSLNYYYSKTNNRITLEYLILNRFNDSLADAQELAEFCKNFPCKVNIIEYNNVDDTGFEKANELSVRAFAGFLETRNIIVNIRKSRGEDIAAACGQLALINNKTRKLI